MPSLQFKSFSIQQAQEYFSQINPLAQRIASDIDTTKSTYGQTWHTLKPNEQNDIINETLIKPEISIKYLDSSFLATSTNPSFVSFSLPLPAWRLTSVEQALKRPLQNKDKSNQGNNYDSPAEKSQTGAILKQTQSLLSSPLAARVPHSLPCQVNGKIKAPSSPPPPPPDAHKLSTPNSGINFKLEKTNKLCTKNTKTENGMKICYAYDGRNLHTYATQEIALKIVFDDVQGSYRDEHSRPFSYCTKSQIDLQRLYCYNELSSKAACKEIYLLANEPNNESLSKSLSLNRDFERLQELKKNLTIQQGKERNEGHSNVKILSGLNHTRFYGNNGKSQNNNSDKKKRLTLAVQKTIKPYPGKYNEKYTPKSEKLLDLLSSQPNLSYAMFTDVLFDQDESAILIQNCGNSGISAASSNSSTNTSNGDRNYEYDDKDEEETLCEDIRLLDNDLNLRKGFDFLNNW